jgi:tetratricopeptide (TPR) repeat protein
MMGDRYAEAIGLLSETDFEWIRLKMWARPKALLAALAYEAMGRQDRANRLFEEARLALEHELETQPEDPRYHSSLGLAYAGLGQEEPAVREGERAVELFPLSLDAMYGLPYLWDLAAIYAMLGDETAAVNEIKNLLAVPSWISPAWLESDFRFDALRENRRFQMLLE